MNTFPIGDFLIRIKNAKMAGRKEVVTKSTKLIAAVAEVLMKEKFLSQVEVDKETGELKARLTFHKKEPKIMDMKLISKPGLRIYINTDELEKRRSPSVLILSTSKGILSEREAKKQRIGGEVLVEIW